MTSFLSFKNSGIYIYSVDFLIYLSIVFRILRFYFQWSNIPTYYLKREHSVTDVHLKSSKFPDGIDLTSFTTTFNSSEFLSHEKKVKIRYTCNILRETPCRIQFVVGERECQLAVQVSVMV